MPQGVLIGREAECDQIQSALAAAADGRGGLLLLGGDAGIGKTRLAAAALARDASHVLHGAARPGGGSPYGAVVAAVRAALREQPGALDDLGPLRAHLSLLLPELGARADAPAGTEHDTLFGAPRAALAAIAAAGRPPLALLLDDLQWSDD